MVLLIMKEYRLGQRLRCIKELPLWYFPDGWSKVREYTVRPDDMYMVTEMEPCTSGSVWFLLVPLDSKDNVFLDLWNDEGHTTIDDYFEACD